LGLLPVTTGSLCCQHKVKIAFNIDTKPRYNTSLLREMTLGKGIVYPTRNSGIKVIVMVGSSYPGAEAGAKGLAVRQLKGYASWVRGKLSPVKIRLITMKPTPRLSVVR
jgi:hypothetical protein